MDVPSNSRKDQRLSSTGGTGRKRKQKRNQEGATHLSAPICLVLKEEVFCSFLQKLACKKKGSYFDKMAENLILGPPDFFFENRASSLFLTL